MSYPSPFSLAEQLRDELDAAIRGHMFPDGITPVVTMNPADAGAELNAGRHVVLIPPPAVDYITRDVIECEWGVLIIAPLRDPIEAWPYLDAVTAAIAAITGAESSRYGNFQAAQGDPWPCTVLTTTTST